MTERLTKNIDLNKFFELSNDIHLVTAFNGDVVQCNPSAAALFQQANQTVAPKYIYDFVSRDEHAFFATQLAQTVASGIGNKFLTRFSGNKGLRWLLWNTNVDNQHQLLYWIGQDVTELKRNAASLEILEKVTGTGIWELDKQTNTPFWSKKTHEIHQTDSHLFTPAIDKALSFFPEQAREPLLESLLKLETDGTPYNLQLPFITAKGDDRIVNAQGFAQKIGNKTIRLYGTFKDVTDEVNRSEEERKMHQRMGLALQFSKIGVWEFRVKDQSLVWDSRMFSIYDVNPASFKGTLSDWQQTVHPEDVEEVVALLNATLRTGQPLLSEFRIITTTQQIRHVRAMASVVYDEAGEVSHLIGVNLDVSSDVERTEQLEQAKEAAEAANQAQSRFLALMSHEIRTPLNGLIGSLQILESLELTRQEEQYVSQSLASARTLVAIINDILDYSKVAADKMLLEELPINITTLIQQVINEQSVLADRKHISLEQHIPADLPQCFKLDPLRFKQIMTNLVNNAIKFTHKGYVSISATYEKDPEPTLVVRILDSGIGIARKQLANLFSPFTQADAATTRKYGGSGLGLSIVQRLVLLMNGTLTVDSEPGEGSCFTIRLPRTPCEADLAVSTNNDNAKNTAAPNLGHLHIIVAEDNEINQLVVEAFMQECNVQARFVENGLELVNAVNEDNFDLILCDIRMPVMNGIEACQKIRINHPDIPILAFTANVMQDDVKAYLEAGFNDVIAKPVERVQLFKQLLPYARQSTSCN